MSTNEASPVYISPRTHVALVDHLWKQRDLRPPDEIVTLAIKEWIARNCVSGAERGYQWKDLFLPHGTRLRIRHKGMCLFAQIEGDLLIAEGRILSPRARAMQVCGSVRNAWRDIYVRRNHTECWTQASAWRTSNSANPKRPGIDRRQHARRKLD